MCLPAKVAGATIQKIATIVGSLLCLNFGLMFGVTPLDSELLQTIATPINYPVSAASAVWIGSHLCLSAAAGALIFGIVSYKIGPKSVLLLCGLLQITGWFCVHFAYDIMHIYSARIFAGFAGGAAFVVLPIFIVEISKSDNVLGLFAITEQARTLGILIGWVIAYKLPYEHISIIGLCVSFVFSLMFPFVQESPDHFMRRLDVDIPSLEKSLRWYRGIRNLDDRDKEEYVRELNMYKDRLKSNRLNENSVLPRSQLYRVITISLLLALAVHLNGAYILLNNAHDIFNQLPATPLPPVLCVIIMALAQSLGGLVFGWISSRIGRKIIIVIAAALLCALSLGLLCVWILYGSSWSIGADITAWLPVIFLSIHMFFASMGLAAAATFTITQLVFPKLLAKCLSISSCIAWLLVFFVIQYFGSFIATCGLVGVFAFFSIICLGIGIASCFSITESSRIAATNASQPHFDSNISPEVIVTKISTISTISNGNGHTKPTELS